MAAMPESSRGMPPDLLERRVVVKGGSLQLQKRDADEAGVTMPKIGGYAAVFGVWADLYYFEESIRRGAFSNAIKENQDVRGLFNHDCNIVLGRTSAGTMRLWEDDQGLAYEIDPPATDAAEDLITSIQRGDVTQCSFSFMVRSGGAIWTIVENGDGTETWRRELLDLDLFDVGPVTFPAYTETSVSVRSLDDVSAGLRALDAERIRRGLAPHFAANPQSPPPAGPASGRSQRALQLQLAQARWGR